MDGEDEMRQMDRLKFSSATASVSLHSTSSCNDEFKLQIQFGRQILISPAFRAHSKGFKIKSTFLEVR